VWLPVAVERESVDHERVAQQVEELAVVADAVSAAEPEGGVEVAVDALGVVAPCVELREVWVRWRDDADVFGPVELPRRVLGCAVEPDSDDTAAEPDGE
jgi:hypothetical protein